MPDANFFAQTHADIGLDPDKVQALMERAERDVKEGLLGSCQVALARHGRLGAMRSFGAVTRAGAAGRADNQTLYLVMSCTKTIFASALWLLLQDGKLDLKQPVAAYIPEFATNGKETVTVEQLFTHTGGFPDASYAQREWLDREARLRRFASWRLQFPAGSRFMYHSTSGFWVLAELLERLGGMDFRRFVYERVSLPLGLPDLHLGVPPELNSRVADVHWAGEPATAEEYRKLGLQPLPNFEVTEEVLLGFNQQPVREAGVPGGGAVATAGDLALFYQALLEGGRDRAGGQIWSPETLRQALSIHTAGYLDPVFRQPPNYGLGVIIAGDDGHANLRGFGKTNSPGAFGHRGYGGQIAWGDPATGLSFAYCTESFDRNELRMGRRMVALSSLAASASA